MIYYGIVDKIRDEHKVGIYGRRPLEKNEKFSINLLEIAESTGILLLFRFAFYWSPLIYAGYKIIRHFTGSKKIKLQYENSKQAKKSIVIPNELLENDYQINNSADILYGLFDEFKKSNKKVFKTLMNSKGGANLVILERDSIEKQHYGGKDGRFNCGIYVPHPKDNNILSNDTIIQWFNDTVM